MNIIATRIGKKIFSDLSLGVASHHGGALRRVRLISSTRIAFTSDPAPAAPAPAPPVTSPEIPTDSITAVVDKIPELGYYPSDLFMRLLESIHVLGDIPYWQSIVIGTVAVRLFILPSSIYGVRMNSRIAFIRPDIDQLRSRMEKDPLNKALYEQEITYLHKKYDANPFTALLPPIIQLPILISIFLGIRRMGTYFPEFMTGGTLWFTDLSVADPTYALPVFSGVTFLLLTELGSSQVNMQNPWFKIALRGISLLAIPLSSTLPSGVHIYWCANGAFSVIQTLLLKQPEISRYFGVMPPPEKAPPLKVTGNPFTKLFKSFKFNKPGAVEYIDGKSRKPLDIPTTADNPPKTVTTPIKVSTADTTPLEPPPKTFTAPPKKKQKKKI